VETLSRVCSDRVVKFIRHRRVSSLTLDHVHAIPFAAFNENDSSRPPVAFVVGTRAETETEDRFSVDSIIAAA